jgi:purine-binding chemotaxis protein CheW
MAEDLARSKLLLFEVGPATYALDVRMVKEVLRRVALQAVPGAHPAVVGALEHRGEVIPVIDLRVRFGVERKPTDRDARCIVAQVEGATSALLVDRVLEVWDADAAQRRELPQPLGAGVHGARAAYSHAGRLVFELEAGSLSTQPVPAVLPSEWR